jgi:hypothetical protein
VGEVYSYRLTLQNGSPYSLNGTQVRLALPYNGSFAGTVGPTTTLQGNELVLTVGRMASGAQHTVSIPVKVTGHGRIDSFAVVTSGTASPVFSNRVSLNVVH